MLPMAITSLSRDKSTFMLPSNYNYSVEELILDGAESPYSKWFRQLSPDVAAKVVTAKLRMQLGNFCNVDWFRGIGEYKIHYGSGWRIYIAKEGDRIIVLLGGGSKKRQQNDIERAVALWKVYKQLKTARRISKDQGRE